MNKDASAALKRIGKHSDEVNRMLMQSEQNMRALEMKVAIAEADDEEEEEIKKRNDSSDDEKGFRVGGARAG